LSSNDFWVVPILDQFEHCGQLCVEIEKILTKVSTVSEGLVKVGYLQGSTTVTGSNGEDLTVVEMYNITHVPLLMVWPPGTGPRNEYSGLTFPPEIASGLLQQGPKRVYETLRNMIPSLVTVPITTHSLAAFFEDKLALQLPHVLLVHKTSAVPSALFKRLSLDYPLRASFGLATAKDAKVFGIDAKDTELYIAPVGTAGAKKLDASKLKRFQGANMSLASLRAWLDAELPSTPTPELTSAADFDSHCAQAQGLCFIAVVRDASAEESLAQFSSVASSPFWTKTDFDSLTASSGLSASRLGASFSWLRGDQQEKWLESFRATFPTLIVINPRKNLFATMTAAYSEANMFEFVQSVLVQLAPAAVNKGLKNPVDIRFERLDKLPTLEKTVSKEGLRAALGGGSKSKKGKEL
jgi:hypothetical protein